MNPTRGRDRRGALSQGGEASARDDPIQRTAGRSRAGKPGSEPNDSGARGRRDTIQRKSVRGLMYRVSREIDFCYGHRLLDYDGKCRHLHGHNGRAIITLEAPSLDARGMLVDFVEIKSKV